MKANQAHRLKGIAANIVVAVFCIFFADVVVAQHVYNGYVLNKTPEWKDVISFYKNLSQKYQQAKLFTEGSTDIGKPLHLFVISADGNFNPASVLQKDKCVILINNGIHPGEPDGIDASMTLAETVLKDIHNPLYKNIVLCIIPVFNIDGALRRSCCSRANQNGPEEYGFRANYKNLDLNRDFIKCDAKNTASFIQLFQKWKPAIFLDTHVSNGADYPYVLTLIATQKDKLTPSLGRYLNDKMLPELYADMQAKNEPITPYVDAVFNSPDSGIAGFLETPRFASGYATLFNTISFITETHMLKPFKDRVSATLSFMNTLISFAHKHAEEINKACADANVESKNSSSFPLQWKLDTTTVDKFYFKGYEATYKKSSISGLNRLYYDRSKPYEKYIPYFNTYQVTTSIEKPVAYIIPQCWQNVIERLKWSGIILQKITKDTMLIVEVYYIDDYKTTAKPYEGHYVHSNVKIHAEKQHLPFFKGDFLVFTNQEKNRYIMETLEPQATDSYFNWGFFDAILQQKEGFSDYVFEDIAENLLQTNPDLRLKLEHALHADSSLRNDHFRQLDFIYKNSPYHEKSSFRYPVFRIQQ
jgi:hypothetical protein